MNTAQLRKSSKSRGLSIFSTEISEEPSIQEVTFYIYSELKVAINSLGIEAKAQAVYQMIAELDKDGSGLIEFDEFFKMMTTRPTSNETREEVHKVFVTFDNQKTGFVALKDLRRVAKELGELTDDNTLQEMIERADFDHDGLVSEEEFYNLLTKKAF
jgi:Ca2+-binding EF-hand superfamily protein